MMASTVSSAAPEPIIIGSPLQNQNSPDNNGGAEVPRRRPASDRDYRRDEDGPRPNRMAGLLEKFLQEQKKDRKLFMRILFSQQADTNQLKTNQQSMQREVQQMGRRLNDYQSLVELIRTMPSISRYLGQRRTASRPPSSQNFSSPGGPSRNNNTFVGSQQQQTNRNQREGVDTDRPTSSPPRSNQRQQNQPRPLSKHIVRTYNGRVRWICTACKKDYQPSYYTRHVCRGRN